MDTVWTYNPYDLTRPPQAIPVKSVSPSQIRTDEGNIIGRWQRLGAGSVLVADRAPGAAIATRLYMARRSYLYASRLDCLTAMAGVAHERAVRAEDDAVKLRELRRRWVDEALTEAKS